MFINPRHRRYLLIGSALAGAAFTTGHGPNAAVAQEVRCYYMVCNGTTCVATQIQCPKNDIAEKPQV
jgi:hypothetical protein